MRTEYFDYLILGDEHHGEIYSGVKTHRLEVRSKYPLANHAHSPAEEAPGIQPRTVNYNVHEYPAQDGRFYMVATNYPLSDFDVEDALIKSRAHPVRA
ncbi:hypothetical protein PFH44_26080 [Raoultella sp. Ech2A]|uniref:hypothetical protein n=1 Tax=Raoultella sp. Ech2A TaxID=2996539 RepID=UPI0024C00F90|nr:hypothetical protein [Raoultella sp. Ech2A]MDJ1656915.1 hypothetical protein [Raoultella sp. Ech2A]